MRMAHQAMVNIQKLNLHHFVHMSVCIFLKWTGPRSTAGHIVQVPGRPLPEKMADQRLLTLQHSLCQQCARVFLSLDVHL